MSRRPLAELAQAHPRVIADHRTEISINNLANWSFLRDRLRLDGHSVLLATSGQLATAIAAVELDGLARRIVLATPDVLAHLSSLIETASVTSIVSDASLPVEDLGVPVYRLVATAGSLVYFQRERATIPTGPYDTEWVLLTSGTTSRPKMVVHTLASLIAPLDDGTRPAIGAVWATFYDIRRYGGLQILLRALLGGGSMHLSATDEPVDAFLARLAAVNVTHISGTPSHWRRALLSDAANLISPAYVRLSGEVADQAILDQLRRTYPQASIAHAFASTEAGVAFDVRDGLAGFPESVLRSSKVDLKIEDGTLRVRSSRTASCYLGQTMNKPDGYIDTGDLIARRGARYYFRGRREGVINIGGLKVFPEEVEAVLTAHPAVQSARVWGRRNPVLGAIVAADVVLRPETTQTFESVKLAVITACRQTLAAHKVPVTLRRVESIAMTASGKIARDLST